MRHDLGLNGMVCVLRVPCKPVGCIIHKHVLQQAVVHVQQGDASHGHVDPLFRKAVSFAAQAQGLLWCYGCTP